MDITYAPLNTVPNAAAQLESLHKIVFGPGRFARTAYRLRENVPADMALSIAALQGTQLVGASILTHIKIGAYNALLLGPLAIAPEFSSQGHGSQLMRQSIEAARAAGHSLIILVGDAPFYSRYGFVSVPLGHITLPGPVNSKRLLACELRVGALAQTSGMAHAIA